MAQSKTELFDDELQKNAKFCKALSHPARLAIIKYLAGTMSCITGDITDELPLSRTTVNQHLMELKRAGVIQGQIQGKGTRYCLDPETFIAYKNQIIRFLNDLGQIEKLI